MPANKKAQLRYKILDECFRNFHRQYMIEDLLDEVNESLLDLYGTTVSIRQIREDIKHLRDRVTYNAPIEAYPCEGRKCYYRYSDKNFSIFNNQLSAEEVISLRTTIDFLGRFRGVATNAWLENVISNLEFRFGVRPNPENVVSFEQNELLKGTEFLGELIDAALNHQAIEVVYRTFAGSERKTIVHPYHIKQFNNRWFLIGLEQTAHGKFISNKALDRIVKFSQADVPFIPNTDIDFNQYFQDIVGVSLPTDHIEPEEIVLQFDKDRFPYVVTKPIHHSQTIEDKELHIIKLFVRPNKELESRILSYGDQVEVLRPQWLREQIAEKISKIAKKYSIVQNDCTDKE